MIRFFFVLYFPTSSKKSNEILFKIKKNINFLLSPKNVKISQYQQKRKSTSSLLIKKIIVKLRTAINTVFFFKFRKCFFFIMEEENKIKNKEKI